MTGMKEGAGDDPFADDTTTSSTNSSAESNSVDVEPVQDSVTEDEQVTQSQSSEEEPTTRQPMQIPYKYRRDGVQDGRDRVPLFLQPETKRSERDTVRELEERLDDDVSLTDLREALVLTGMNHLDEVETQLEEWGYGMVFDT